MQKMQRNANEEEQKRAAHAAMLVKKHGKELLEVALPLAMEKNAGGACYIRKAYGSPPQSLHIPP